MVDLFSPDFSSKNIDLPKIVEKEKRKLVCVRNLSTLMIYLYCDIESFSLFVGQMQKQFRPSANNEDEDEMKDDLFPPSYVR